MMQVVVSFNFNEGGECDASCDLSRGVQRPMQENLAKTDFAVEAVSVHVHAHLPIHDVQGDSDGAGNSEGNGNSFRNGDAKEASFEFLHGIAATATQFAGGVVAVSGKFREFNAEWSADSQIIEFAGHANAGRRSSREEPAIATFPQGVRNR